MSINPGEEFKLKATPSPELARKLAYLAAQDNDSVLTAVRSSRASYQGSGSGKARSGADMLLQVLMARLADPAYQALSEQINGKLDLMDEASVHALQEIEEELAELRRERERMREQAYRDEQGRRIFMTSDESAAYYEDGGRVEDERFAALKDRLRGKPTWDKWQDSFRREEGLTAEREQIHQHEARRDELRDDLATGSISKEEAQRRAQEIGESMPERVRRSYKALEERLPENAAVPDASETPAQGSEGAAPQPAADPRASGARLFQPG